MSNNDTMSQIIADITTLGREDAKAARAAGCEIVACADIEDVAVNSIRDILRGAGDARANMVSIGYRAEGSDLMHAYETGWDEVADGVDESDMNAITYHIATTTSYQGLGEDMGASIVDRSLYSAPIIGHLLSAAEDPAVIERCACSLIGLGIWKVQGDDAVLLACAHYDAAEDWEDDDHPAVSLGAVIQRLVESAL